MTHTDPEVRRAQQKYPTNKAQFQAISAKLQAAESQLSTLREGLRKLVEMSCHNANWSIIPAGAAIPAGYKMPCTKDCAKCEAERILSTSEGSRKVGE